MKRSLVATDDYSTLRLIQLPFELLCLILSFLDVASLHSALRCLFIEYNIQISSPEEADTDTYSEDLKRYLTAFQSLLQQCHRSTYQQCEKAQLKLLNTSVLFSSIEVVPHSEIIHALTRACRIIKNQHFPLLWFIDTGLCQRCQTDLVSKCYWSRTPRPLFLCRDCDHHVIVSTGLVKLGLAHYSDGYAWIPSHTMKELCGVSKRVKATDWADLKGIRRHSNSGSDRFGNNYSKEHYFLLDVFPHKC